ncbi:McrB family protein [Rufibacter ruber]|uniref:McrB family protein n=1 Tax=Rufibacter ruber TaxID=1783499 RepID=UPI000835EB0B|nr:AAA family ATPase [Rufibacter ruber]
MKPDWANQQVYECFDDFIEKSIINDDSFITNNPGIFTIDNLNACVVCFVDNPDLSNRNFDAKSKDQFSSQSEEVKEVFAHFIWLWSLSATDMTDWGKKNAVTKFLGEESKDNLTDVFLKGGIGSAGQYHKLNKPFEISYLLLLFREIKKKLLLELTTDVSEVKKILETLCLELYNNNEATTVTGDDKLKEISSKELALHHIMLHFSNPNRYEAIAAKKHKVAIVNTFYSLLDKEDTTGLWDNIDESILAIRQKLVEMLNYELSFYDVQQMWNFEDRKEDISIDMLFEYKKAMVFYGPPGTSKTHSANRLAEVLISKQYFRNKKNLKEFIQNPKYIFDSHIHHLQLHSNYNYEDFIAGLHIEEKSSVVKPGYLLRLIEKVKGDHLPHVLILDEINRVDISRLFGELFSALEYRNKRIQLSVGDLEISLPDNLYFIGTMNEIDFSLERIDFALRRRFLWQFMGFDKNILKQMIQGKNEDAGWIVSETDIDTFINRCERLNYEVSSLPELGQNYQIGHTFFAEIIDIFKTFKKIHSGKRNHFLQQPVKILWEVSIKPILQAFLGNMDNESKSEKIKSLQRGFVNG